MSEDNMFDELGDDGLKTVQDVNTQPKDVVAVDGLNPGEPEWNDFVMELFQPEELMDGNPMVAGLRRVAEKVLGEIVFSGPTTVIPPKEDNEIGRSVVIYKVQFADGKVFSDVADVWEQNTDPNFLVFGVATASTRAEARALRKALKIRCVAAEELTNRDTAESAKAAMRNSQSQDKTGEYKEKELMTDRQDNFIVSKCRQLNVNRDKFMKEVIKAKGKITKKQASDAIDKLQSMQQDKKEIPESILGFEE